MNIKREILLILFVCGLFSCENRIASIEYPPDPCTTLEATYEAVVQPIIDVNCYRCHDQTNAFGGVVLEGYSNLLPFVTTGLFMNSILGVDGFQQMPNDGLLVDSCDVARLQTWVDAGAPNN